MISRFFDIEKKKRKENLIGIKIFTSSFESPDNNIATSRHKIYG